MESKESVTHMRQKKKEQIMQGLENYIKDFSLYPKRMISH